MKNTFEKWLPNVDIEFITDVGHYLMEETPVYPATLVEQFFEKNR